MLSRRSCCAVAVLAIVAALIPLCSHAKEPIGTIYAGVNGVWTEGPDVAFPADVQAGGTVRLSLNGPIQVVGSTMYGFDHSYFEYTGGARFTVTDVDNRNLSVGLGAQYHGYSQAELRPDEWMTEVSLGWRPLPLQHPKLIIGGQAAYGLTSERVQVLAAIRYEAMRFWFVDPQP